MSGASLTGERGDNVDPRDPPLSVRAAEIDQQSMDSFLRGKGTDTFIGLTHIKSGQMYMRPCYYLVEGSIFTLLGDEIDFKEVSTRYAQGKEFGNIIEMKEEVIIIALTINFVTQKLEQFVEQKLQNPEEIVNGTSMVSCIERLQHLASEYQVHAGRIKTTNIEELTKLGPSYGWTEQAISELIKEETPKARAAAKAFTEALMESFRDFSDLRQTIVDGQGHENLQKKLGLDPANNAFLAWSIQTNYEKLKEHKTSEGVHFSSRFNERVPWNPKLDEYRLKEDDSEEKKKEKIAQDPWCGLTSRQLPLAYAQATYNSLVYYMHKSEVSLEELNYLSLDPRYFQGYDGTAHYEGQFYMEPAKCLEQYRQALKEKSMNPTLSSATLEDKKPGKSQTSVKQILDQNKHKVFLDSMGKTNELDKKSLEWIEQARRAVIKSSLSPQHQIKYLKELKIRPDASELETKEIKRAENVLKNFENDLKIFKAFDLLTTQESVASLDEKKRERYSKELSQLKTVSSGLNEQQTERLENILKDLESLLGKESQLDSKSGVPLSTSLSSTLPQTSPSGPGSGLIDQKALEKIAQIRVLLGQVCQPTSEEYIQYSSELVDYEKLALMRRLSPGEGGNLRSLYDLLEARKALSLNFPDIPATASAISPGSSVGKDKKEEPDEEEEKNFDAEKEFEKIKGGLFEVFIKTLIENKAAETPPQHPLANSLKRAKDFDDLQEWIEHQGVKNILGIKSVNEWQKKIAEAKFKAASLPLKAAAGPREPPGPPPDGAMPMITVSQTNNISSGTRKLAYQHR